MILNTGNESFCGIGFWYTSRYMRCMLMCALSRGRWDTFHTPQDVKGRDLDLCLQGTWPDGPDQHARGPEADHAWEIPRGGRTHPLSTPMTDAVPGARTRTLTSLGQSSQGNAPTREHSWVEWAQTRIIDEHSIASNHRCVINIYS